MYNTKKSGICSPIALSVSFLQDRPCLATEFLLPFLLCTKRFHLSPLRPLIYSTNALLVTENKINKQLAFPEIKGRFNICQRVDFLLDIILDS